MTDRQVQVIERALEDIREAKRPTFWQVTKETIRMLLPTLLMVVCGFSFYFLGWLWCAIITWVVASLFFFLQVWVLWTSVKVRRQLFELRDKLAKVQSR